MDHYSISGIGNVETGYGTIGGLKLWGHAEKNKDKIHTYILAWNQFFSSYRVGLKYDYDLKSELIDFFWGKTKSNGTAEWDSPKQSQLKIMLMSGEWIRQHFLPTPFQIKLRWKILLRKNILKMEKYITNFQFYLTPTSRS